MKNAKDEQKIKEIMEAAKIKRLWTCGCCGGLDIEFKDGSKISLKNASLIDGVLGLGSEYNDDTEQCRTTEKASSNESSQTVKTPSTNYTN